MRYMPTLTYQVICFVYSAGLGFILGFLYDLVRIVFYSFTGNDRKLSVVRDLLYSFMCLAATFLFLLVMCDGKLMFYIFIGEGTGLFIYLYALSGIFILPVKRKIDKMKHRFLKIKSFLIGKKTDFANRYKILCKNVNKRVKKSKKDLHSRHKMVYNSSVKLYSHFNKLKNRGDENGQSREEET